MTEVSALTAPAFAVEAEWRALHEGTGLADLSATGRLRITGADALDLLNRLTTNKLESLPPGTARDTVVTNGNGRIVDFLGLASLADGMLCLASPGQAQTVIDWLDTYTFGEDITVVDRTPETAHLALAGPRAVEVLTAAGVTDVPAERDTVMEAGIGGANAVVWRAMPGGRDGFHLVVESGEAEELRSALTQAGATPVGAATWEAYRVANGLPVHGREFDASTNPLEVRLRGAISEDKGCYTGQEVIARLLTYRKVQRRLMAVELDAPADAGSGLADGGSPAGTLTSSAVLPDGRALGLALVPMKLAEAGRALATESGIRAVLAEPTYALATEPADD